LGDRESFGKGHVDDVYVAARDLLDHVSWRHWLIEPVLARLEVTGAAAQPQRDTKRQMIANDTGIDQPLADPPRADAGRDVDELFRTRIAAIGRAHPLIQNACDPGAEHREGNHDQDDASHKVVHDERYSLRFTFSVHPSAFSADRDNPAG